MTFEKTNCQRLISKNKENGSMEEKMKSFHLQISGTGGGALLQSSSKCK